MLSLLTVFALHVPPSDYLTCEDYKWLKSAVEEVDFFTPSQKFNIITRWINHTDPHCFDNKDAHD